MSTPRKSEWVQSVTRFLFVLIAGMLVLLLLLTAVFLFTKPRNDLPQGLDDTSPHSAGDSTTTDPSAPLPVDDGVTLPLTPDKGQEYQDSIIFVGDSLTAHLINREVLSGGTATHQVWRCENNMLNLNSEVTSAKIIFPGTGEKMTIAEAAKEAKPPIMILTLGTDWGVAYLGEEEFKSCYTQLVKAIQKASPKTRIILQSIFPVTADCTLLDNAKIDNANQWVKAIAAENGCRYLDTQSVLKDQNNHLKAEFCNSSDGIHLGRNAYEVILTYIRTHALTN